MAVILTLLVTDDELAEIAKTVGTIHAKSVSKHVAGDGHHLKSQKASATVPGFSEIELVLDYDPRKELKRLGILGK